MSEIIEFRRRRGSGQFIGHTTPKIKLTLPRGEIVFYKKVLELMSLNTGDAVMFAFNKKNKVGYIYKEEPEDDSYILKDSSYQYLRFTSKQLGLFIIDVFELDPTLVSHYFIMKLTHAKDKFKFQFTYDKSK